MADYATLIPVNVITGFLGSGKTTLLKHLLSSPRLEQTAVLVNELGEVGLDHHLIRHVAESTLVLENGCICCAMRGDLEQSLRDLLSRRERGEIAHFERLVIETSGLSDPVPIAYTVLAQPVLQHHYRLANVITVVDALNGESVLERYPEALKQVAIADRLVLSKTDLLQQTAPDALLARLRRLNPSVPVEPARAGIDLSSLLTGDAYDSARKLSEVRRWLREAEPRPGHDAGQAHDGGIRHFVLELGGAVDWVAFGVWMTMLLNRHGESVLRVKGFVNVADMPGPVLINGVQHIVHPPTHLVEWPDENHRSRIVFVVKDLSRSQIQKSLATFCTSRHTPCGGPLPRSKQDAIPLAVSED